MKKLCILSMFVGILLMGCSPSVSDTKPTPSTQDNVEVVSVSEEEAETTEAESEGVVEQEADFTFNDSIFSEEVDTLSNLLFDKDSVQMSEVQDWAGVEISYTGLSFLTNMINYYDQESLMSYVSLWDSSNISIKEALAVFVSNDIISEDSFIKAGADADELQKILKEFTNDK